MNWDLITLDVLGNEEDGFEINAAYSSGRSVFIPMWEYDQNILQALKDMSAIDDEANLEDIEIDGDQYGLYISDKHNGCPMYELRPAVER